MKFTLTTEAANKLHKFAKAYVNPKTVRTDFTMIACHIESGTLTATMLDPYKGCILQLGVNCDTDGECFILPPTKAFKKSDGLVIVTDNDKGTSYQTGNGTQIYSKKATTPRTIFPLCKIFTDPVESVWMNPSLLAKALTAFDNEPVRIDFLGEKKGVMISNSHAKAIVLPVNRRKEGEL